MIKKAVLVMVMLACVLVSGCIVKEVQVVCNRPYIPFGTTCCLDQDSNSICDEDDELLAHADRPADNQIIEPETTEDNATFTPEDDTAKVTEARSLSDSLKGVVIIEVMAKDEVVSYGSGFFVDPSGYILTNTHVIDKYDPTEVEFNIETYSGAEYKASLIDWSWDYDIALMKVKDAPSYALPSMPFGSVDDSFVGDEIYVLGSPMGLQFSMTKGILSGKHRNGIRNDDINDYIQIDAALNPGNSGGPIINSEGKVIGLATFGYLFLEGLNFALESDTAKRIYEVMKTEKAVIPDASTPKCRIDTRTYLPVLSSYGFKDYDTGLEIGKPGELDIFYKESDDKVYFNSITLTFVNKGNDELDVCFRMKIINNAEVLFNQEVGEKTSILPDSTLADLPVDIKFKAAYNPDWFYYELTAFDCKTREKYYDFYRKDRFSMDMRKGDMDVFEHC